MKKVVVGLSGGVDSSVAAYLLKESGYEVIGLFMRNWHDESVTLDDECPWIDDSADAMLVAQKLGIPFQTIDLSAEYKQRIVDYMFAEYEAGRTPNPDVLCNREIKFDVFLKYALALGADFVATGHYCQKSQIQTAQGEKFQLLAGADNNKDQSYFLCQISQEQLSKALFPIGHLQKSEVRSIAASQGLVTANKKDSQGLCFVGHIRLPDFLQQQLKPKKGKVILIEAGNENKSQQVLDLNDSFSEEKLKNLCSMKSFQLHDGKVIGEHNGAHFYTIGQRKGLNIGGYKNPLFVLQTDVDNNIIYVGEGEQHTDLYRMGLSLEKNDISWIRNDLVLAEGESMLVLSRIRYRQALSASRLFRFENRYYLIFEQAQKGVAKGQFAAWYIKNELLGSGIIA